MEKNNHVLTCEEVYNSILSYIDKLDEKYGYEYLVYCLTSSEPTEEAEVYAELNHIECALAGETGIATQYVRDRYTSVAIRAKKLVSVK